MNGRIVDAASSSNVYANEPQSHHKDESKIKRYNPTERGTRTTYDNITAFVKSTAHALRV